MLTRVPDEFLNVFRVASKREVVFTLVDKKAAERMRFKFNKIRARMRKENHPLINEAERVQFQIRDNTMIATPAIGDYMDDIVEALMPHQELLKQAQLQEAESDDKWLAEEAIRLTELQDKMHKRKAEGQVSVQELLRKK